MKALILVGGFGTRLRPLTLTLPKPLVPFCNKPMIEHQIMALAEAGVTDIVLAVNYRPEVMVKQLQKFEVEYNIKIHFSVETEPLGTAGPLALAREILGKDDSCFFVLNSDIVCPFPFKQMLEFHKKHGKEGSILVTRVEEPSKYGVIVCKPSTEGQIESFVEKPKVFVSNKINAGIYIFNPAILKRIELKPTSIEKEIFPKMATDGELFAMDLKGYWMDVGQPKDFLTGIGLHLSHVAKTNPEHLAKGDCIVGHVLIDPSAKIGKGCRIGPDVNIGANVVIEDGVRLSKCCIMDNSVVKANSWIGNSIIGWSCTIGRWTRLEGVTVLGEDVQIKDEIYINGAKVLPHKEISASIAEPDFVL